MVQIVKSRKPKNGIIMILKEILHCQMQHYTFSWRWREETMQAETIPTTPHLFPLSTNGPSGASVIETAALLRLIIKSWPRIFED